jgi:lantibiotic modifying enzyme
MTRYVEAAARIGSRICEQAFWHDGRCNWVGALPDEDAYGRTIVNYAALGPDLYGGTSGVALFLAHLHAATGDPQARRTALAALRHAHAHANDAAEVTGPGLYAGRVGIALASVRAGLLLGEDELVERAGALLADLRPEAEFDLMTGNAGTIVGLLALGRLLDRNDLAARAHDFGRRLVADAQASGSGASWRSPIQRHRRNLTGLSHGAAGAAVALLELWRASGEAGYRDAALAALAYERALYAPAAGNWPDLRTSDDATAFATFWCHGAPGIALARLRTRELLGDETSAEEARAALATTRRAVTAELASGAGNFSLCHGLAGNAEILFEAARRGADADGENARLARAVADAGVERHVDRDVPWPCGTFEGETACLFLGLAGIGLFYLRLDDPARASVLLVEP